MKTMRPTIVITVDTEEEWDWTGPFPSAPYSTHNIQSIPKFQEFAESLQFAPTYFVDYAVAIEEENCETLKYYFDRGSCDIGAHMHPWCNPPLSEEMSAKNSHAVNLPVGLFEEKLKNLTELLTKRFSAHPLSFRSGRWGLNGELLEVLSKLGYKIDSSVRPFYEDKYFSYRKASTRPYWPSFGNILESDPMQRNILEVPTASGFNHKRFEMLDQLHEMLSSRLISRFRVIGILWKLGILRKITVTPEGQNWRDICRCIDMYVKRGDSVIGLFFHSSDLLAGNTEYVKNEADEQRFYETIRRTIDHVRTKHDANFCTMRQLSKQYADLS